MRLSLSSIPRDKVLSALMLVAIIAMLSFTNHVFKKLPARDTQMVGMATLQGRGEIPSLHMVMDHNTDLADLVAQLSDVSVTDVFVNSRAIDEAVADILLRWAGADRALAQSFGPYIDARVVIFLQKAGVLSSAVAPGTEIPQEKAEQLTQAWFDLYDHYRTMLLAQAIGKKIYKGGVDYNLATDKATARGDLWPDFIKQFDSALESSANSAEAMRAFLDFVDATKGFSSLSDEDQDLIMSLDVKPKEDMAPSQAGMTLPKERGKQLLPPGQ